MLQVAYDHSGHDAVAIGLAGQGKLKRKNELNSGKRRLKEKEQILETSRLKGKEQKCGI